jgi:hypothetical protein
MTTKNTPKAKSDAPSLDRRYGKIGISAVVAAMRYQSEANNRSDAPMSRDDRRTDAAA